ncbi:MAG: DUF6092 family protein [candidate division NC10 bacterium]
MRKTEKDNADELLALSEQDAFDLVAHLVASAETSATEPELYGPYRLLDATSRLIAALLKIDPNQKQTFLRDLKQEIDDKKDWLMWDREGFRQLLPDLAGRVASELKRRRGRRGMGSRGDSNDQGEE